MDKIERTEADIARGGRPQSTSGVPSLETFHENIRAHGAENIDELPSTDEDNEYSQYATFLNSVARRRGFSRIAGGRDGDDMGDEGFRSGAGCGESCKKQHSGDGNCLKCGQGWGSHSGHACPTDGARGSWRDPKSTVGVGGSKQGGCDENCTMSHIEHGQCLRCGEKWGRLSVPLSPTVRTQYPLQIVELYILFCLILRVFGLVKFPPNTLYWAYLLSPTMYPLTLLLSTGPHSGHQCPDGGRGTCPYLSTCRSLCICLSPTMYPLVTHYVSTCRSLLPQDLGVCRCQRTSSK